MSDAKDLLKEPFSIYTLLKNILKSRQLIDVSFPGLPQYCLTTLLAVDYDSKIIQFDQPNPQPDRKLLVSKQEARFSLKLDGLPVIFRSKIATSIMQDGDDLHVHFPQEVFYPQQRFYYRFNTSWMSDIEATIYLAANKKIPCRLDNISINGLCLRLPYAFAALFPKGKQVDDIYISLPGQQGFSVMAKVINTRIENSYQDIVLGLQIYQQKQRTEKTIQQFILRGKKNK